MHKFHLNAELSSSLTNVLVLSATSMFNMHYELPTDDNSIHQ